MKSAKKPHNEHKRLKTLNELDIMDTIEEQAYDDITKIAAEICDTPIALVSLLDDNRQWFKSHHGLEARETPRDFAFCGHTILQDKVFIVENSREDDRFHDNPLVTGDPEVIFYAGYPLTLYDGTSPGSLCVIDNQPRKLTASQVSALEALGRQVEAQLNLRYQNKELQAEQQAAKIFYEKIVHNGCLEKFNIEYHISPYAIFGGDCILSKTDLEEKSKLHLVLADMTGHGLGAAIGLIPLANAFYHATSLSTDSSFIVEEMNTAIRAYCPEGKYCSACYICIDKNNNTLNAFNAALPAPIHYSKNNQRFQYLSSQNLPLGGAKTTPNAFTFQQIDYEPGDQVIMFSDGMVEVFSEAGEMLGIRRLNQIIESNIDADNLFGKVTAELQAFANNEFSQNDDLSFIHIKL